MQQAKKQKADEQMRAMQMQHLQMQMEQQKAAAEQQKRQQEWLKSLPSPQMQAASGALAGGGGPTVGNAAAMPKVDPTQGMMFGAFQNGLMSPADYIKATQKEKPKIKDYKEVRNPDGTVSIVGLYDDGSKPVNTGQTPFIKPEARDFGGFVGGIDPISGKVTNYGGKTFSPSDRVSMRGQNMTDERARERLAFDQGSGLTDVGGDNQAALTKAFGKAQPGYRWKADGSMEQIPGGPADRKANEQLAGKETVDNVVASLRSSYDALEQGGGITSTKMGAAGNLTAAVSRSGLGQTVGGAFGTRNQKERDAILQARPMLLQAIMKATGMSAKQMDSNAELKLYLSTATDPTLTLEANREALDRIEQLFGSGGGKTTGERVIKSDADYEALPSGAVFTGPDGKKRRKP